MIFDDTQIDRLPDYGDVVNTCDVMEKLHDMVDRGLAFEPDYTGGNKIALEDAEELLLKVRAAIKEIRA